MEYKGMRPGFADEAIDVAWATWQGRQLKRRRAQLTALKYAATVPVLVALLAFLPALVQHPDKVATASVTANSSYMSRVNLLVTSEASLPDATITLLMDNHVRLAGYPDDNRISWRAPIAAGNNRLVLPVMLRSKAPGVISIAVDASGWHRQITFTVNQQGSHPAGPRPI